MRAASSARSNSLLAFSSMCSSGITANADDLGRLHPPAHRHGGDRLRAVGDQDVAQHVGNPLDLKGTAAPIPIPRIVLADGAIGTLVSLDERPLGFFGFQGRFMRAEHSRHSMGMSTAISLCA